MQELNTMGELPQLMTQKDVAAYLGVTIRTVASYKAKGVINCVQRGRWVRFKKEDVQAFLDSHYVQFIKAEPWKQ